MGIGLIAPGARLEATRCSERGDRAIKSALTAALSTARSAEKSRATVAGAATFDRRSTASWISPGVSPIRSTEPR